MGGVCDAVMLGGWEERGVGLYHLALAIFTVWSAFLALLTEDSVGGGVILLLNVVKIFGGGDVIEGLLCWVSPGDSPWMIIIICACINWHTNDLCASFNL